MYSRTSRPELCIRYTRKRKVSEHVRRRDNRTHKLKCGNLTPLVNNRDFPTWARLASSPLSTFPQARLSTASQRLTSLFAECIHRPIHMTLALHPRGRRDSSVLSCWPWAPVQRSTCPPSLPSPSRSGQQPSAHATPGPFRERYRSAPAIDGARIAAGPLAFPHVASFRDLAHRCRPGRVGLRRSHPRGPGLLQAVPGSPHPHSASGT
jgi:hypothetical protein